MLGVSEHVGAEFRAEDGLTPTEFLIFSSGLPYLCPVP